MAKLSSTKIEQADIEDYLRSYSDFAFEVSVLRTLTNLGLQCTHGGTYEDPVTRKARQYDIHAVGRNAHGKRVDTALRLAVECKNLRPNFPLVVHCLPRTPPESFIDVVWSSKSERAIAGFATQYGERVRLTGVECPYLVGEPVGKAADQVGKRGDEIVSGDQDTYDRLSQALNSAFDLLDGAHFASIRENPLLSVVIPVVVVPAERLWIVDYDTDGKVIAGPSPAPLVSYFVDRAFEIKGRGGEGATWYTLSHLEICEAPFLPELVRKFLDNPKLSVSAILDFKRREFDRKHKPASSAPVG